MIGGLGKEPGNANPLAGEPYDSTGVAGSMRVISINSYGKPRPYGNIAYELFGHLFRGDATDALAILWGANSAESRALAVFIDEPDHQNARGLPQVPRVVILERCQNKQPPCQCLLSGK